MIVVIVLAVVIRILYDWRYPIAHTGRRAQKKTQLARLVIFFVLTAQLLGWNIFPMKLGSTADSSGQLALLRVRVRPVLSRAW